MLCTSAVRGEGTTTLAANLALAFAELGKYRVLLIEASFRRAAIAEVFGFKPPKGFALQLARHRARPMEPWVVVQVGAAPLYVLAVAALLPALPGGDRARGALLRHVRQRTSPAPGQCRWTR